MKVYPRIEIYDATPADFGILLSMDASLGDGRADSNRVRGWLLSTIHKVSIANINILCPPTGQSVRCPVGYVSYIPRSNGQTRVSRIAVDSEFQCQGIGRALVDHIDDGQRPISLAIPEDNLGAQLWLRSCGFRCTRIHRPSERDGLQAWEFERQPIAVVR